MYGVFVLDDILALVAAGTAAVSAGAGIAQQAKSGQRQEDQARFERQMARKQFAEAARQADRDRMVDARKNLLQAQGHQGVAVAVARQRTRTIFYLGAMAIVLGVLIVGTKGGRN